MKNVVLIIFLFCVFRGYSQVLDESIMTCEYRVMYVKDILKPEVIKEEDMVLQIGKNISRFYSYDDFKADSSMRADVENNESFVQIMAKIGNYKPKDNSYSVYTNYPDGKLTYTDRVGVKNFFVYEEDIPQFNWQIQSDTLTILGYVCYKAECSFRGRDYVVWFTTELPLSFGPWKFGGLPGLILKAEDTQGHYCFECFSLSPSKDEIVLLERDYTKTDRIKLNQTVKRFNDNPLSMLQGGDITIKDEQGKPITSIKKAYNPIELE